MTQPAAEQTRKLRPLPTASDAHWAEPSTWRSAVDVRAAPEHVLDTLTEVEAVNAWSPVDFDLGDYDPVRLSPGMKVHVSGSLVGRRIRFLVEIVHASPDRLVLRATGPLELVADYVARPAACGAHVEAAISVNSSPGLRGLVISRATRAFLAAGALSQALQRIATEAERRNGVCAQGRRCHSGGRARDRRAAAVSVRDGVMPCGAASNARSRGAEESVR